MYQYFAFVFSDERRSYLLVIENLAARLAEFNDQPVSFALPNLTRTLMVKEKRANDTSCSSNVPIVSLPQSLAAEIPYDYN